MDLMFKVRIDDFNGIENLEIIMIFYHGAVLLYLDHLCFLVDVMLVGFLTLKHNGFNYEYFTSECSSLL